MVEHIINLLTKGIPINMFLKLKDKLNDVSSPFRLRGRVEMEIAISTKQAHEDC